MENKISAFIRDLRFLTPIFYHNIPIILFLSIFSRVSQEEVKKWAESLENLISHECKSDSNLGWGTLDKTSYIMLV